MDVEATVATDTRVKLLLKHSPNIVHHGFRLWIGKRIYRRSELNSICIQLVMIRAQSRDIESSRLLASGFSLNVSSGIMVHSCYFSIDLSNSSLT